MGSKNGWQRQKIGDCAELISNHFNPNGTDIRPYIGLEHIQQQTLKLLGIGKSTDVVSGKYIFKSGDILFGKLRPYFRKVVRPKFDGVCSTDIWVIRAKDGTDQGFLYYLMASEEIVALATQGSEGTKMPRAKWDFLKNVEINLPPYPEQQKIASILSTLDDKIELNHEMTRTLEKMAQVIFKSWFVDFEPFQEGEFEYNEELDKEIPKRWEVKDLKDYVKFERGIEPGSKNYFEHQQDDMIPFLRVGDLSAKRPSNIFIDKKLAKGKICIEKDVLFSLDGTVGIVAIGYNGSYSTGIRKIVITDENIINKEFIWCFLKSGYIQNIIKEHGAGRTTITHAGKSIDFMKVTLPDKETMSNFHNIVWPLFKQIIFNINESKNLAQIRNTLLPKLLSGEIRVNVEEDAEVST